jgi:hypothetical protein
MPKKKFEEKTVRELVDEISAKERARITKDHLKPEIQRIVERQARKWFKEHEKELEERVGRELQDVINSLLQEALEEAKNKENCWVNISAGVEYEYR